MFSGSNGSGSQSSAKAAPRAPRAPSSIDCDVCVVGAGVTGLWIARDLARRGYDVIVLGAGPSAPPPGILETGFELPAADLIAAAGRDVARELVALADDACRRLVGELDAGGSEVRARHRLIVADPAFADALPREQEARDTLGLPAGRPMGVEGLAHLTGIRRYAAGLLTSGAATCDGAYLELQLADEARRHGARLMPGERLRAADLNGVRKHLHTAKERIRAAHVVFAREDGLAGLVPALARATLRTHFVTGRMRFAHQTPGFDGLVTEFGPFGSRFDVGLHEISAAIPTSGRVRFEMHAARIVRGESRVRFAGLGDLVESGQDWTGTRAPHRMPLVGELRRGVWHALAFGRSGLAPRVLAAELIATAIAERDDRIALFSAFPPDAGRRWSAALAQKAAYWKNRIITSRQSLKPQAPAQPEPAAAERRVAANRNLPPRRPAPAEEPARLPKAARPAAVRSVGAGE